MYSLEGNIINRTRGKINKTRQILSECNQALIDFVSYDTRDFQQSFIDIKMNLVLIRISVK